MKLAAIDNGYWSTKVYTKSRQFDFRSKFEKASDMLNSNNTMNFTYDNVDYIVGEGASMNNVEYDKTSNELHKICTYAALADLSNYIGTEFNLIVGYPLNAYISGAENFAEYLKTDNFIETVLNGETKLFKVNECTPFPQCAGAMYANIDQFKNKVRGIIDIGGLTVNGCIFENLNLVRESMFTENLGSIILNNKIKKALEIRFGISIQDYEISGIKKNGLKINPEESLKIANEVMQSHVEEIKKIARINKWNIDNLDITFTGGTSIDLEKQIKDTFHNGILSENPVYDNVKGFNQVAEMVYGEKNI